MQANGGIIKKNMGGLHMTIKEMNDRRKELGYSYEKLAELSGVPMGTVQKVLGGITKSPRYDTLIALERVLQPHEPLMIRESVVVYGGKRPGEYTLDDYYALPDEDRVELIDGVLYNMSEPTSMHQVIAGKIYNKIDSYITNKKGKCVPIISPIDVQLDCDNKTMVQPDVIVVCDRDKFRKGVVYGAPDFIVEVLSPSTAKKDMGLKLTKYADAGVREYWVVDPKKERVIVYVMSEEDYYNIALYSFHDEIPVYIFGNECIVNFQEIQDYIGFLYEK